MGTERKASEVTSFTVDQDASGVVEMPSITRLLNRKKIKKTDTSTAPPKSPPPFPGTPAPLAMTSPAAEIHIGEPQSVGTSSPIEIQLESVPDAALPPGAISLSLNLEPPTLSQPSMPSMMTHAALKPTVKRRAHSATSTALVTWDATQLQQMSDPLAQGLVQLIQKGVQAAVFLAVQKSDQKNQQPIFKASAQFQAQAHLSFWQGMQWNPELVPELWNYLLQTGHVELSPSGAVTQLKSNRNVVRGAFGVLNTEWLTLIRVGSQQTLRGILAVLSNQSVATHCQAVRATLEAPAPKSPTRAT